MACFRRDERHLVPVCLGVLQVVDAGQLMHHACEGLMCGDVVDLLPIQPDLSAVFQAVDIPCASHGPLSCGAGLRHSGPPSVLMVLRTCGATSWANRRMERR